MDPFERHNIKHLSASSLNTFVAQPAYWTLRYLLGFKDEGNEKMWRGSAVEAGLDKILFGQENEAVQAMLNRFEEDAQGEAEDGVERERNSLPAFLENARTALEGTDRPVSRQMKIEHWFDGIEVPIVGYTDYEWEDHGLDLKTTHRIPRQEIPSYHARQIGFYSMARKKPFKLLYVSTKDSMMREISLEEAQKNTIYLEGIARSVKRALSVSSDPVEIARLYAPDFDSFYWNDEAKEEARKIWEI